MRRCLPDWRDTKRRLCSRPIPPRSALPNGAASTSGETKRNWPLACRTTLGRATQFRASTVRGSRTSPTTGHHQLWSSRQSRAGTSMGRCASQRSSGRWASSRSTNSRVFSARTKLQSVPVPPVVAVGACFLARSLARSLSQATTGHRIANASKKYGCDRETTREHRPHT